MGSRGFTLQEAPRPEEQKEGAVTMGAGGWGGNALPGLQPWGAEHSLCETEPGDKYSDFDPAGASLWVRPICKPKAEAPE